MIRTIFTLTVAVLVVGSSAAIAPASDAPLRTENNMPLARFGRAVAIEGDLMAVAAPGASSETPVSGHIYLYRIEPGGRLQFIRILTDDDAGLADLSFGTGLAIDNGRLIVGAPGAPRAGDLPGQLRGAVAVFTFERDFQNLRLEAVIGDGYDIDVDLGVDWFGFDVDIEDDLLAVASVNAHEARGEVHLYRIARRGFDRIEHLSTIGADLGLAPNDAFGHSVSIDGDLIAIGADKDDGADDSDANTDFGAAYLFHLERRTGATQLLSVVRNGHGVDLERKDFFGASVALDQGRLYVGAPGDDGSEAAHHQRGTGAAYVFDIRSTSAPRFETMAGIERDLPLPLSRFDMAGYYVAADSGRLAIGAPYAENEEGHLYLMRTPPR